MRLIAAILLSLSLVTAARAGGSADGLEQAGAEEAVLLQAAKSLVQVIADDCTGDEGERSGSGFALVNNGLFVTDLHVVAGCNHYKIKSTGPAADEYPATLVHILKARDLALLKVDPPPPGIPGLQISSATPQFKETFEVIGFPEGLGTFDSAPLSVTLANTPYPQLQYAVDPQAREELNSKGYPALDTQVVRVNGSLEPGDSGAPLIDWKGNVAGIGDGGLQRGTVGIGWATRTQYITDLMTSSEPLNVTSLGVASVDFAYAVPKTKAEEAASKVKCGELTLVRGRHMQLGELIKTTDDPIKLRKLVHDLVGAPLDRFDNEKFTIWTEPTSGAGIALPKELRIEAGSDHCTVHTGVPNIDYIISLASLSSDPTTAEWELEANRQHWLAYHRATAALNMLRINSDRKHSVVRRFENGGIIVRRMASGWSKDHKAFRVFTNDLSGRGAFVSIVLVNRDAKPDPADLSEEEQRAWALGLFAVNLTALPPPQEAAATSQANSASDADSSNMVWPGPRSYPHLRCGDLALIPLSQPRTLADLRGPADIDTVLRPSAGTSSEPLANDLFDVWVQPLKGAVVLLPHGLKLAADQPTCRSGSASASISFALRVVDAGTPRQADAAAKAFVDDLVQASGARFRPDPAALFVTQIDPNGLVKGQLLIAKRPDGSRTLIYHVSLRRDQVLTLFAMTDTNAKTPDALAPAERDALAQALAAVRLSTLLPPTGFLTAAQRAGSTSPAAPHSASQ